MVHRSVLFASICLLAALAFSATGAEFNTHVFPLIQEHCLDCHAENEPEGQLIMESYESLMKGGESGASVVPNNAQNSLLVKFIEGRVEVDGKKKLMPPGKRKKLTPDEIKIFREWIDAGASKPATSLEPSRELRIPKIATKHAPRRAVQSLATSDAAQLLAVARYGEVELRHLHSGEMQQVLKGHHGAVNAVAFSGAGDLLVSAAGEPALFGEIKIWKSKSGELLRTIEGHKDALYSVAISPNGKILASGSYDQKVKLWEVETGKEVHTLSAHNGAIYDLTFRADGKVLASASGDRTVKLWDVQTGKRLDTLSQSLKELYAVAFSPDGKRLIAGGVDNRIRVWEISETAAEGSNVILHSRFAHDAPLLNLAFSPDGKFIISSGEDRIVKVWDASSVIEKISFTEQIDLTPAISIFAENRMVAVGRLDGTLDYFDISTGKSASPAALKSPQVQANQQGK